MGSVRTVALPRFPKWDLWVRRTTRSARPRVRPICEGVLVLDLVYLLGVTAAPAVVGLDCEAEGL